MTNIHRIIKLGVACGALLWAAPSYAGFELVSPSSAPRMAQPSQMTPEPPMPVVPAIPVEAEPLAPPQHILRNPHVETLAPAANEPTDSAGLLKAVSNNQQISVAPQIPAPANAQGRLVINPYPLQDAAAHGNGMGQLSLEQAMIEETGNLRSIAIPGRQDAQGMIKRAQISAQYDDTQRYSTRDDSYTAPVAIENIAPTPAPAQPMQQAQNTDFTEAVGFGRDLPLALALSQIVPPEYKYNFAQNIDAGATVSWQGGKPWNQVLDEMLAPSGMRAVIDGQQVIIQKV